LQLTRKLIGALRVNTKLRQQKTPPVNYRLKKMNLVCNGEKHHTPSALVSEKLNPLESGDQNEHNGTLRASTQQPISREAANENIRLCPHNIEAELSVVGCHLVIYIEAFYAKCPPDFLEPEHFLRGLHSQVYETCWRN